MCLWDWKDSPEGPLSCVPMRQGKVGILLLLLLLVQVYSQVAVHPVHPDQFLVSSKASLTFFTFDQSSSQLHSYCPGSVEKVGATFQVSKMILFQVWTVT